MKYLKHCAPFLLALFACITSLQAQIPSMGKKSTAKVEKVEDKKSGMEKQMPVDEKLRMGKLDNGMHYYIRQNQKPEDRMELRLAVNAGAMQEDENQRGLAHFVEHMAFNGTTNFEKNDLINFLESTGVRFGADLNAYTSFDETVYMLQLPTDQPELIDKGLLVMSDWATGITFADEEIDKERGVIESEWRTGLGADERMRRQWWPKVFEGSRYAERFPIGKMEVIRNAPYERFRSFYKDWYRPDLMAIIVVGDFEDIDQMEADIKSRFSKLENPKQEREKEVYEVPDHEETYAVVATDPEATNVSVNIFYKHAPNRGLTLEDFRNTLMRELYNRMLNERLSELQQKADAPFTQAFAGYGNFVRAKDMYYTSVVPKEEDILKGIQAVLLENERVLRHGFLDSELQRQKQSILRSLESDALEGDKQPSASYARAYVSHFLSDNPIPSAEQRLQLAKDFLPNIRLKELNALAEKWITDENRSIVLTAPEKEGLKLPTKEAILNILKEVEQLEVAPYEDKFLDLPLLAEKPEGGKVVNSSAIEEINTTVWELSNGVRVVLKPTDFQNDRIYISAFSPGGHSLVPDEQYYSAAYSDAIVMRSGVGAFDEVALDKKLSGNIVSLRPYIGELYEGFNGYSSSADFETMLQLVYLYSTAPRKDENAYKSFMSQMRENLRNMSANPQSYFMVELQKMVYDNNLRRTPMSKEEELDKIDFEQALAIYKERFADASDFTFVFTGSFDIETIKPQIEQYLGGLPSINRKEDYKDLGIEPQNGQKLNIKKGLAPQSTVLLNFNGEMKWTPENASQFDALVRVLNINVRENLREEKGGVYSPRVFGNLSRVPDERYNLTVYFQCAPEDVTELIDAVKEEVAALQKNGASEENLVKVRETRRRGAETSLENNRYWLSSLTQSYMNEDDPTRILDYEKYIKTISSKGIQKMAKRYIDVEKAIIATLNPEKEEKTVEP